MNKFYVSEKLSEHMAETPDGFLICYDVPVARIGEQLYKAEEVPIDPDSRGLVTIKRREEEVFNPSAMMSFEGKPFTLDHPDEAVTPENWDKYANGFMVNVRRGERERSDFLIGDIIVTTQKAIERIKEGEREISCGYDADYEQLDKGIGIQKNIIGNHIALVDKGRAGHRCAIGDKAHECTNCGNCKKKVKEDLAVVDKNNNISLEEEDENDMKKRKFKMKDRFMKIYRRRMKDADFEKLPEEEKVNAIADEFEKEEEIASDDLSLEEEKKAEVVKEGEAAADQGEEEEASKVVGDPVVEEAEGKVTMEKMYSMMEKLVGIVEAFVTAAATGDKKTVDQDEEEEKKTVDQDEEEEKKTVDQDEEEEKKETEDDDEGEEKKGEVTCDAVWHDIAYRADLLYPGVTLNKPTSNHMIELDSIKRKALKRALTSDSAEVVKSLIGNKDIKKLKNEALDIAFMAASEAVKNRNNKFVTDSVIKNTKHSTNDIQSIQKRNETFWKRNQK